MKNFKKFLAIFLSIAMVLGMSSVSFAEGEETTLPDLVLDGGEDGGSPMIGTYTAPTSRGQATDAYKYMGWASLLDSVPDTTIADGNYRYLVMTYTGDITQLRFEFTRAGATGDGSDDEKEGPYWFNPEGQTYYFVTADETPIPLVGDNTTIVIDLAKSVNPNSLDGSGIGVGLDWYNSGIHMHCDEMVIHGEGAGYTISNAYLTTTLPVIEEETTEAPSVEETTEAPSVEETTEAPVVLPDEIVLDDGDGGAFVGHVLSSDVDGYAYGGYVYLKEATSDYKYLQLTYTGSLLNTRFEIEGDNTYWFDTWQAVKFVDVNGNDIDTSYSDAERTVVIDLAASGAELGWGSGLHIHTENLATNGGVTFIDGRLLKTAPVEEESTETPSVEETTETPSEEESTEAPSEEESTEAPAVLPDVIVLDGDDTGASALIGSYNSGIDGYAYLGYVYLKEATADYKYLQMTYTGSLTGIRLENDGVVYWFNEEGQTSYFVTADGSDIPLTVTEPTTIVIDLEASGLELGWDGGMHIHSEGMLTNGALEITDARLLKTYTPAPTPEVTPVTITVEAEDYTASEGVSVKTVDDAELVYTIHENDYMEYTIDVAADGYYRFNVVAGRSYTGSSVIALKNAEGYIVANATITTTGGWDVCEEFAGSLVYLKAGTQTVTLYAVGGSYNVDSFSLVPETVAIADGTIRVEAEAYDSADGIEVTKREENDTAVVYCAHNGDYMVYTIDVAEAGNYTLKINAAKEYGIASAYQLIDASDAELTRAYINNTGSWRTYQEFSSATSVYLEAGTQTVTLLLKHDGGNLDYFELVKE